MEPYSVDYDYYYNSKDRPQEASSNRKNFHAITFPNVIVFIKQKNNDCTVYLCKKFPLLLPLVSKQDMHDVCRCQVRVFGFGWKFFLAGRINWWGKPQPTTIWDWDCHSRLRCGILAMTFFILRCADNVAVPATAKQNNNCEKAGFPLPREWQLVRELHPT